MLYREWLYDWLENYAQPSCKQRTYARYKEIIAQHIAPRLGDIELSEITPYALQRYVTTLLKSGNLRTGKGLSPNSVNTIISVLQSALKTAFSLGMIAEYVGNKIKRPKSAEKKVECFSLSEQKKIERFILQEKNERLFGILLCLYTGVRIGELLALEWSDVDINECELRITKSCHYGKDQNGKFGRITEVPKTQASVRTIPLPRQLLPYLLEAKKKSRSTHVVSNGKNFIPIRSYQRTFSALLKKLNIEPRGFHSLRHTFATRALECGMDVKTLSEILGHKSATVTLNRYAHSLTKHKREMMNELGKIL